MKICIVIPYNLLEWHHGNAIRVMNLVKFLSTHHELYLLMYDQFNKRRTLKSKNITSKFISVDPWIFAASFLAKYMFRAAIYRSLCANFSPSYKFESVLKEILQNNIDILQCENVYSIPPCVPLSKKMDIPIIATLHDVFSDRSRQLNEVLKTYNFISRKINENTEYFEKKAVKSTDFNVCVSESDKGSFIKMGIDPHKLMVIPNGVDSKKFCPREKDYSLIEKLGLSNANPILLFAGSNMYQNRIAVRDIMTKIIPKTIKVYKNLRVLIVGTVGNYVNSLKQKFSRVSKYIVEVGFVNDLNPYYSIADIVLIPLRYGTGTKLKILEAMAAGKCIISTNTGAKGIKVKNQNTLIIEDNMEKYSEQIVKVTKDNEYRSKLEKNARITACNYDWRRVFKRYDDIYAMFA